MHGRSAGHVPQLRSHATHLSLSQFALSLHVLEAARLSPQLSFCVIQLLLSACQLKPAGFDTDPQGIQLATLISHLPLETVMLAAGSVQQALQLPDLTLLSRKYLVLESGVATVAAKPGMLHALALGCARLICRFPPG